MMRETNSVCPAYDGDMPVMGSASKETERDLWIDRDCMSQNASVMSAYSLKLTLIIFNTSQWLINRRVIQQPTSRCFIYFPLKIYIMFIIYYIYYSFVPVIMENLEILGSYNIFEKS